VLDRPFLRGDSVYGRFRGDTLGIAIEAVERAARPRLDGVRTVVSVAGGLAAWVGGGLLASGRD
jgi:hypothetical protein